MKSVSSFSQPRDAGSGHVEFLIPFANGNTRPLLGGMRQATLLPTPQIFTDKILLIVWRIRFPVLEMPVLSTILPKIVKN
jgi:hypothetical protein